MKWYNENKTVSLNLDLITFWRYMNDPMSTPTIHVFFGTTEHLTFQGNDAKEIYNMLTPKKEVI